MLVVGSLKGLHYPMWNTILSAAALLVATVDVVVAVLELRRARTDSSSSPGDQRRDRS